MLKERFGSIDYEQEKQDVLPFITDPGKISLWGSSFFQTITENLNSNDWHIGINIAYISIERVFCCYKNRTLCIQQEYPLGEGDEGENQ